MNNEEKILFMLENLVQDVSEVKQSQAVLEREVGEVKNRQSMLQIAVDKFDRNQAVMQKSLSETKNIVARIENDHGLHIKALHDGHAVMTDLGKEIRADIKDALDVHDVHIKVLENIGK